MSLKLLGGAAAGGGGGGGGNTAVIESLYVPRIPLSPAVRPGRTWRADFNDQDLTNKIFDFTQTAGSWSYTTDAGDSSRPVVTPPTPYPAIGFILAKNSINVRDFEAAGRFKAPAGVHTSTVVQLVGRYVSEDNYYAFNKNLNPATPLLEITRRDKDGGSVHSGTITSATVTLDTTTAHIYKFKFRAVGNVFWGKSWESGTAEPDWQVVGRSGASGGVRRDIGLIGIRMQDVNGGLTLSELTVTELLTATDNVCFNGDFSILGAGSGSNDGWTSGVIGWTLPTITSPVNSLSEWVTVAGPDGATRRFWHIRRPAMTDGVLPQLGQEIYRRDGLVGNQLDGMFMDLLDANYIEIGVTSKVTNARHGGVASFMGMTGEAYWWDETATVTNVSSGGGQYYKVFGINRANAAGDLRNDGQDGMGTWGWRRDLMRIDVSGAKTARPNRLNIAIGPHDNDTLVDDAWIGDVTVRPVA